MIFFTNDFHLPRGGRLLSASVKFDTRTMCAAPVFTYLRSVRVIIAKLG